MCRCIICNEYIATEEALKQHLMDEHGLTLQELQNRPNSSLEAIQGDNYRRNLDE